MDEASPEYTKLLNVEIWDSIPSPYFRLSSGWFPSLRIALANVFQDHDGLLRCARKEDCWSSWCAVTRVVAYVHV
eukprot:2518286-Prymnesium_polylepis.1